MGFLTIADIKPQLSMTGTADDAQLSNYADVASDIVEQWCGPVTLRAVANELAYGTGSGFVLRGCPVSTLDSVTYSGLNGTSIYPIPSVADFTFDPESGVVSRLDGARVDGPYRVSYTTGYEAPPPWALLAGKLVAQNLWETRRGPRRPGAGTDSVTTGGFAIPNQAAAVMAPHRRVRVGI